MAKTIFGKVRNSEKAIYTDPVGITADEVFSARSLRPVVKAATADTIALAADGATEIMGFIEFVGTAGSTDGDDKAPIECSCMVSYEAPVVSASAVEIALTQEQIDEMIGCTCGVLEDSNIIYADTANTTAGQQVLIVTGGKAGAAGKASLYVRQNPNLLGQIEAPDAIA